MITNANPFLVRPHLLRNVGILLFIAVAFALAEQSPFAPLALIVVSTIIFLFSTNPLYAVYLAFLTKPLIDVTWSFNIPFVGLNLLKISGVAFPILAFLLLAIRRSSPFDYKLGGLFLLWILLNFVSYFLDVTSNLEVDPVSSLNEALKKVPTLFQLLNSVAAYFIVPFVLRGRKDRERLFLVLIYAGAFPLITGLLQISGIIEGNVQRTTGELQRIAGFYHDSTNMRMYAIQSLVAVVGYSYTARTLTTFKRALLLGVAAGFLVIIYHGHSKAAFLILTLWGAVFLFFRPKASTFVAFTVICLSAFALSDIVEDSFNRLFRKELSFVEGEMNEQFEYTLLSGRLRNWEVLWSSFESSDLIEKFAGIRFDTGVSAHSDFLRVLISNGVFGLIVYCFLLGFIAIKLIQNEFDFKDGLSIAAALIYVAFLVDSIGLVPSIYPGYCWVTFGLVGLALNRPKEE